MFQREIRFEITRFTYVTTIKDIFFFVYLYFKTVNAINNQWFIRLTVLIKTWRVSVDLSILVYNEKSLRTEKFLAIPMFFR